MSVGGNLVVNIGANLSGLTRGVGKASGVIGGFASKIGSIGVGIAGAATAAFGFASAMGAVGVGLKSAMDMEQAEISFRTILGSAETAKAVLADLWDFAATTPFEFPEIVSAAKQLAAFGFTASELEPTMRKLGDLSAGLSIPLEELAYLFGTTKVEGRLMAKDLNQFLARGIPLIDEFAKQFGVAKTEIRGMVTDGKITFAQVETALESLTGEGGKFHDLTKAQSQSMAGLFSTLKDSVVGSLRDITNELLGTFDFKGLILRTTEGIAEIGKTITFGIRNAGALFELGMIDWQIMVAENMALIGGTFTATWDASLATFDSFVTNMKAGFQEIGNFTTAFGGALADFWAQFKNGLMFTGDAMQAFTDGFTKRLAEQQNAVIAGNPIDVFADTFRQSMDDVAAGMPSVTDTLIAERERILAGIAKSEAEVAAARAAGTITDVPGATDPAASTGTKDLKGPAAAQRGSADAFKSIFAAMRGDPKDPIVEVAKTTKEQLAETKRQSALLRKQANASPVIEIVAGRV